MTPDETINLKLDVIRRKFNFYRQWNKEIDTILTIKNWASPREKRRIIRLILEENLGELRKLLNLISIRRFTEKKK